MNDKPTWKVAHLDDIERHGRDIPVREHLGIHAFGINAYAPGEDGTLINEHDEAGSGQEELYIVLDGKVTLRSTAAFDAPPRTLVFVGPESRRKATGDGTVLAVGATPGEAYQGILWGEAWPFHSESMAAYGEQRYADALEAVRDALSTCLTTPACITTTRALQRSRATPGTRRSPTSDGLSNCSRGSAKTRAETTTSPPYAMTRGSWTLFAERVGPDHRRAGPSSVTFPNAGAGETVVLMRPPRSNALDSTACAETAGQG